MKTVWVYEKVDITDMGFDAKIRVFADEKTARAFWEPLKEHLLNTYDDEEFEADDRGDALYFSSINPDFTDVYYHGIKEYLVEE